MTEPSKIETIEYQQAPVGLQRPPRAPGLGLTMSVAALASATCLLGFTMLDRVMRLPVSLLVIAGTSFVLTPILAGLGFLWGNDAVRQPGGNRSRLGVASMIGSVLSLVLYAAWFGLIQFL